MRHLYAGRKLNRTSSHKKALMRNLAMALFEHKKIHTTEAKAKELRPFAEKLITKAKQALAREQQGLLPEGQSIDIHNRRVVSRLIHKKAILQELFDAIAPTVASRDGGYTRIIKTGIRKGDAGRTAIIELVDWSAPQDGAVSAKGKKRVATPKKAKAPKKATPKEETPVVAEVAEEEVVDTVVETTEAPVAEEVASVEETVVAETTNEETVAEAPAEEVVAEAAAPEASVAEAPAEEAAQASEEPKAESDDNAASEGDSKENKA